MSSERRILSGIARHFLFKVAGFRCSKFNSSGACLDFILNQSSHAKGFLIQWQPAADAFSNRPKRESRDVRKVKRSETSKQSRRGNWILSMKETMLNIQIPLLVYSYNLAENCSKAKTEVDNCIFVQYHDLKTHNVQKSLHYYILGVFSFSALPQKCSGISKILNPNLRYLLLLTHLFQFKHPLILSRLVLILSQS